MTEQRPGLIIRQCKLRPGIDIKLRYLPIEPSPDPIAFYCDNAFQDETGICCNKNGSERCPVYLGMIERLISTGYTTRRERTQTSLQTSQSPRLAGPRNNQAYLSEQKWPPQSQ